MTPPRHTARARTATRAPGPFCLTRRPAPASRLVAETAFDGATRTYDRDPAGRLTARTAPSTRSGA
ncbi:RHS repeat domain-containing protein [Streptomyces goshikiensis]